MHRTPLACACVAIVLGGCGNGGNEDTATDDGTTSSTSGSPTVTSTSDVSTSGAGSSDGGDGSSTGESLEGFEGYVTAYCEMWERLAASEGRYTESLESCRDYLTLDGTCNPHALAADEATFTQCAAWLQNVGDVEHDFARPEVACMRIWLGEVPAQDEPCADYVCVAGAPCEIPPCESGTFCQPGAQTCSTCVLRPGLDEPCDPGIGCHPSDELACSGGVCTQRQADGQPCTAVPCAVGLFCDPVDLMCKPPIEPGQPCGPTDVCQGFWRTCIAGVCADAQPPGSPCQSDLKCLAGPSNFVDRSIVSGACVDNVCEAYPACTQRAAGQRCRPEAATCIDGTFCDFVGTGTCQPELAVGDPCVLTTINPCADGLYCDGNCQPRVGLGEPCPGLVQCSEGSYCDASSTCVAQLPDGAGCTLPWECQAQYCAKGTCGFPVCTP